MAAGAAAATLSPSPDQLLQQRQALQLSPEQVEQLQSLSSEAREARKAAIRYEAEAKIAEIDFNALMQQETIDLAKVEATAKRFASLLTKIRLAPLSTYAKVKALLTPDQRQTLQQPRTQVAAASGGS